MVQTRRREIERRERFVVGQRVGVASEIGPLAGVSHLEGRPSAVGMLFNLSLPNQTFRIMTCMSLWQPDASVNS